MALYHEDIGKPEHIVETLSSLELSTNGVHRVAEWCALTFWPKIPAVWQHSIRTATVSTGWQTHQLGLNYNSRLYWPPVLESRSVRHDVVSNATRYGSVAVPRNLPLVVKIQPDKVVRWCPELPDGKFFWRIFAVFPASHALHISGLHSKFAQRSHHVVDIQFPTTVNRRGKKKKEEITGQNYYNGLPYYIGWP